MRYLTGLFLVILLSTGELTASVINKEVPIDFIETMADSAIFYSKKDRNKALSFINKAEKYANRYDDQYSKAKVLFAQGYLSQVIGTKDKSIVLYLEALEHLGTIKNFKVKKLATTLGINVGMIFHDHFRYDDAIDYYERSIKIARQEGLSKLEAIGLYFVARSLREKGDFEKAINELYLASEISMDLKDYPYLAKINGQLGLLFKDIGDYQNSIKYYFEVFKYKSEIENFDYYAERSYHNVANVYLLQGNIEKAEEYFLKSIDTKVSNGREKKAFISYMDLAEMYMRNDKLDLAQLFFDKALATKIDLSNNNEKFKIYKHLADLSLKKNDMDSYMKYTQQYTTYLENDITNSAELAQTDQKYNIQLVTQRYYELVAAKQREEDLKRWALWASIIVLLSIATYFTIAKIRAYRLRKLMEKELREAMVDLNLDDL